MDIKMRYNVGDHVAVIARRLVKVPCPFCGGEGKKANIVVDYDSNLYTAREDDCLHCDGRGMLQYYGKRVHAEGVIEGLAVIIKDIEDIDDEACIYLGNGKGMTKDYFVSVDEDNYGYVETKAEKDIFELTDNMKAMIVKEAREADEELSRKLKEVTGL